MVESRDLEGNGFSLGVLVIGSLYWENKPKRKKWRRERLNLKHKQYVWTPIRYGRCSQTRGESYTMVFSAGLNKAKFGRAIVIPCNSQNIVEEARHLWTAEGGKNGISACWGCAGLLLNPNSKVPAKQLHSWCELVANESCYGQLSSARDEPVAVNSCGFLNVPWPKPEGDSNLELDALLATATSPKIVNGCYPSVKRIAKAWVTPRGREHVDYFCKNRESGIQTFQDDDILKHLRDFGHVY